MHVHHQQEPARSLKVKDSQRKEGSQRPQRSSYKSTFRHCRPEQWPQHHGCPDTSSHEWTQTPNTCEEPFGAGRRAAYGAGAMTSVGAQKGPELNTVVSFKAPCRLKLGLYYTILYCLILYYTILYYTILYYTILYYTILYYTILYYTILYYTILYYTILYYTILYNFV